MRSRTICLQNYPTTYYSYNTTQS